MQTYELPLLHTLPTTPCKPPEGLGRWKTAGEGETHRPAQALQDVVRSERIRGANARGRERAVRALASIATTAHIGAAMSYLDRYKSTTAADRPPPPPTPSTNATQPPPPQYGDRRVARAADAARIRAHNRLMRRRLAATQPQIVHRHSEIVIVARREARARHVDARERRRADLRRSERESRRQRRSSSPAVHKSNRRGASPPLLNRRDSLVDLCTGRRCAPSGGSGRERPPHALRWRRGARRTAHETAPSCAGATPSRPAAAAARRVGATRGCRRPLNRGGAIFESRRTRIWWRNSPVSWRASFDAARSERPPRAAAAWRLGVETVKMCTFRETLGGLEGGGGEGHK